MKIEIDIDEKYEDLKVDIKAPKLTPDIEKVISMLKTMDMKIAGKKKEEILLIDKDKILFVETVERNSFLYTKDDVYESNLKLYELEQEFMHMDFIRVSKQCIINLRKIKSLKADVDRKIKVTLINGESIIVSRMYADELRKRLGVK